MNQFQSLFLVTILKVGNRFIAKNLMKACLAEVYLCYTDSNVIFGGWYEKTPLSLFRLLIGIGWSRKSHLGYFSAFITHL